MAESTSPEPITITLSLDPEAPYRFKPKAVAELLRRGLAPDMKLVIDPEGLMDTLSAEIIAASDSMPAAFAAAFRKKEQERTGRMQANLKAVGEVLPKLVREIRGQLDGHTQDEIVRLGTDCIDRLCRMEFGLGFVHVRSYTRSGRCPNLYEARPDLDDVGYWIDDLVKVGRKTDADRIWLAKPPGESAREVADLGWGELDFQPKLQRQKGIRVFLPLAKLGSTDPMAGYFGGKITKPQWATYGLPWVASAVMRVAETFRLPVSVAMGTVAWKLDDYAGATRL